MKKWLCALMIAELLARPALAQCDLESVIGYTLAAKREIVGRIDPTGMSEDYRGCDYERVLLFDDRTGLKCTQFFYASAYRPIAYIWTKEGAVKICVDGNYLTMRPWQAP